MSLLTYSNIIDPWLRSIRIYAVSFSGIKKRYKILDVCCGTGDQAFFFREKAGEVAGIDKNEEMIAEAQKRKRKDNIKNVSFQIGNATSLPFPNNYFDLASISLGLHEMKRGDRNTTISEMKRVVKENGNLIFIDFRVPLPKTLTSQALRLIEYMAGKENYSCFKDYLNQGGLPVLVAGNGLEEEKRDNLGSHIISLIKTKN